MPEVTSKPQELSTGMEQPILSTKQPVPGGQQLILSAEKPSRSTEERKERMTPCRCKFRDSTEVQKTAKWVEMPLQACATKTSSEASITHSRKCKGNRANDICLLPPADEESESK